MTDLINTKAPVLITGESKLVSSVAVCLMLGGQQVVILCEDRARTFQALTEHQQDLAALSKQLDMNLVDIMELPLAAQYSMAIILTDENLLIKKSLISLVEDIISPDKPVVVNTESITLSSLQKKTKYPQRIMGVNWVVPAHTTYFLEVILNDTNDKKLASDFVQHAKQYWNKDPYVLNADKGIRARLICALIREAFYLVENGYVSFEDIDRACRNDAGYYLPFAGNFRYMDLMGTYIYGVVMKDMNPDLSKQKHVPPFFDNLVQQGKSGMEKGAGFYEYSNGDAERWKLLAKEFSYQISDIIKRYQEPI